MKRETVGKLSQDLLLKHHDPVSIIEQGREMRKPYLQQLEETVRDCKSKWDTDFFVVVIQKTERLMRNVLRNFFLGRLTCPTPDYDQTVWHYNKKTAELEFIWAIPSKEACLYLLNNRTYVDPQEHDLLKFVLDFKNGELYKLAKRMNGEKHDSIETQKE